MQQQKLTNQVEQLLHRLMSAEQNGAMNQEEPEQPQRDAEPEETIHVYFVRESAEPEEDVVESTLAPSQNTTHISSLFSAATVLFCLLLPLSAILFQLSLVFHPPIATLTIIPSGQTLSFTGMVQMGRILHPITLSQSQTIPTKGKGHQDATKATGIISLYNGQFTSQSVPVGTILTGADGVQVITDQDAIIPAGDPPSYGQVTISAHAVHAGKKGNIPAYDINIACCFASVLAKNPEHFTGGQDARDFRTVTRGDMNTVSTLLKTSVAQSLQGALQGQLQPNEQLFLLPCTPTIISDHQPGEEAASVTITVSQTCSAVAYNTDTLYAKAQELLCHLAVKKIGTGYSLLGQAHVTITQATVNQQTKKVVLSITAQGTFVYALNYAEQEHMKKIIEGKSEQEAKQFLTSVKGIKSVSIQWDEHMKLSKDTNLIRFVLIYSG